MKTSKAKMVIVRKMPCRLENSNGDLMMKIFDLERISGNAAKLQ